MVLFLLALVRRRSPRTHERGWCGPADNRTACVFAVEVAKKPQVTLNMYVIDGADMTPAPQLKCSCLRGTSSSARMTVLFGIGSSESSVKTHPSHRKPLLSRNHAMPASRRLGDASKGMPADATPTAKYF